jgi:hypothetical protein
MMDSDRQLLDYMQIQQLLALYCRGIDSMDRDLIASVYWEDAYDQHVIFAGSPQQFIDWVLMHLSDYVSSMHFLGQSLVEFDGDTARGETYFTANHVRADETGEVLAVASGRYLDTFQRRGGSWRIYRREVVIDQRHIQPLKKPAAYVLHEGSPGPIFGERTRHDRSYSFLAGE